MLSSHPNAALARATSDASRSETGLTDAPPADAPIRKRRCYSGCAICRARKVKCDERPGGCGNCERLQLKCPGNAVDNLPSVQNLQLPPQAGSRRKKTYRSCELCRSSKTRCSGDRPACQRCRRKQIECAYDSEAEPAWTRAAFAAGLTPVSSSRQESQGRHPAVLEEKEDLLLDAAAPSSHSGRIDINISTSGPQISHEDGTESLSWLYMSGLPSREKLCRLIDEYFANVHPLRCFGFIHKPSFMQKLDEGLSSNHSGNALLFTVCALGAKFVALDYTHKLSPLEVLAAGNKWSREAQRMILVDLDTISVENLMASVLLHDHELRVGRFASAFMLSGVSARMAQALQVNVEYSTDVLCTQSSDGPSPAAREARRRLMWCCYIMDSTVGSGVDELTLLDDSNIKVQLPCSDRHFVRQKPAVTETLVPGHVLKFLTREVLDTTPAENMGIAAYLVRLTSYRKRVLRYVKHLDTAKPPWLSNSEFSSHDRDLKQWVQTLPNTLRFTPSELYIRKDSQQLGALCHLHCTFHQTMCDLYRIGMPRLFKIRVPVQFPPERLEFLASVQQTCFYHAQQIARILQTAAHHGVKTLADPWFAIIAHDSNRVMLYHLTKVLDLRTEASRKVANESLPLVLSNLDVLHKMMPLFSMSKSLYEASSNMLRHSELGDLNDENTRNGPSVEGRTAPGTPVQSTPEYVLNPLAIYRLARRIVPDEEKHAPELISSPKSHAKSQHEAFITRGTTGWSQSALSTSFDSAQPPLNPFTRSAAPLVNIAQPSNGPMMASSATGLDDLQMFFTADFDTSWQPADTILQTSQWGGIAPWGSENRPRTGLGIGEVDMFMPSYPWPIPEA